MSRVKYLDYRNFICKLRRAKQDILVKMKSRNYFILMNGITSIAFSNEGITANKCGPMHPTTYDFVFMPYESIDNIRNADSRV